MKKTFDTFMGVVVIVFFILTFAVGAWFMDGGDLRDLKDGCYDSQGC